MNTATKDMRLHIRCSNEVRSLLDKAAGYAHMTVSEFVLRNAVEQAENLVQQHETINLSQADFAAFLQKLDEPGQISSKLKCAGLRHEQQVQG